MRGYNGTGDFYTGKWTHAEMQAMKELLSRRKKSTNHAGETVLQNIERKVKTWLVNKEIETPP